MVLLESEVVVVCYTVLKGGFSFLQGTVSWQKGSVGKHWLGNIGCMQHWLWATLVGQHWLGNIGWALLGNNI